MHICEQNSGHSDPAGAAGVIGAQGAGAPSWIRRRPGAAGPGASLAPRRWWTVAAWIGGILALFALMLRISLSGPMTSDEANNALQAWDMLHGNLLLHGWIIGDATYYTFELPMYVITESLLGLHSVAGHVVSALTYVIVAACAMSLARAGSGGLAAAARRAAVLAVLAVPLVTLPGVSILTGTPNHFGTSAIMLGSFILIDRAPDRRFTAPLLGAILCAGQVGDATVLYVAVPAVLVVCAYHVLAARKIRTGDAAIWVAAAVSVPLASLIRAAMRHLGAYSMIRPRTRISLPDRWLRHAGLALRAIRTLFGMMVTAPVTALAVAGAALGLVCLLAAIIGFARAMWTWGTATRAEQLVCVAIVVNIAIYVISTIPGPRNAREMVAILPCGAVLAARLVPGSIASLARARIALAAAVLALLLPLTAAAIRPPATPPAVPLAAWLEAHGLSYGIAGYWDASAVTVQSGNHVQVRAVRAFRRLTPGHWETKPEWYKPSAHDATFVIADPAHTYAHGNLTIAAVRHYLGPPVATARVAGRLILIYRTNLLRKLKPPLPPKKHSHRRAAAGIRLRPLERAI